MAVSLRGDLACARCSYSLKGLSVRGACPECGCPVAATILAVVDPHAQELQPIRYPRWTAIRLVLWSMGALFGACVVWAMRLSEVVYELRGRAIGDLHPLPSLLLGSMAISALGATALIRPHRSTSARRVVVASIGVACAVLTIVPAWVVHTRIDRITPNPYFNAALTSEREIWRLLWAGIVAVAITCLWNNLRLLVARSHLMRTGAVDRQAYPALLGALAMGAVGDALLLAARGVHASTGGPEEYLRLGGLCLVGAGSLLFTIGLLGVAIDTLRLYRVVVEPPLSVASIVAGSTAAARRVDMGSVRAGLPSPGTDV